MKWKTAISTHKDGELYVRGHALAGLINKHSFTEMIFLLLAKRMPNEKEVKLLDAVLVSCAEHGVEAPSAFSARVSVSTGNSLHAALAAGILATGEWHGGALEKAAEYLQSEKTPSQIVRDVRESGGRLAGLGHKIYKDKDPRAELLFAKAKELGFSGNYVLRMHELQNELEKQSGKKLPINIDGAGAALISELGFDWRLGKAIFVLGRLPGMIAHAHEEMVNEKPYRRFSEEDVEYVGPEPREEFL